MESIYNPEANDDVFNFIITSSPLLFNSGIDFCISFFPEISVTDRINGLGNLLLLMLIVRLSDAGLGDKTILLFIVISGRLGLPITCTLPLLAIAVKSDSLPR